MKCTKNKKTNTFASFYIYSQFTLKIKQKSEKRIKAYNLFIRFSLLVDIIFSSRKNAKGLRASSYEPSWGWPCPSSLSDHHRLKQLIIFAWIRLKERTRYEPLSLFSF